MIRLGLISTVLVAAILLVGLVFLALKPLRWLYAQLVRTVEEHAEYCRKNGHE